MTRPLIVRACSCGRSYTRDSWSCLPPAGILDYGDGRPLELRNCACRSTISVEVSELRRVEEITPRDREPGIWAAALYLSRRPWWRRILRHI